MLIAPPNSNDPATLLPAFPLGAEILIARLRSLGDIVLETPGIAALHAWRPDLRICVLVEPRFAPALEGNPAIAELIFSRALPRRRSSCAAVVSDRLQPARRAAQRYAHGASGSPLRVGWKGFQFSFPVQRTGAGREGILRHAAVHTVEHRISQFYSTGLPRGPIPRAQVFPQPDAIASVAASWGEGNCRGRALRGAATGGAFGGDALAVAKFAELARWLREKHGIASVVNLGARDQRSLPKFEPKCKIAPQW